jgi:hypothetical protein
MKQASLSSSIDQGGGKWRGVIANQHDAPLMKVNAGLFPQTHNV